MDPTLCYLNVQTLGEQPLWAPRGPESRQWLFGELALPCRGYADEMRSTPTCVSDSNGGNAVDNSFTCTPGGGKDGDVLETLRYSRQGAV